MDKSFLIESIIRISVSILFGAVFGLERKIHNHVMGMRTLILICVSSTLLSIVSFYMASPSLSNIPVVGDPTRVVAGVVSGIGFIGGGVIMKQGLNIKGLTSSAIIWTDSAIGLAIGCGLYIQAGLILVIAEILLVVLEKLESKFFPSNTNKMIHLCFNNEDIDLNQIKSVMEKNGLVVVDLNMSKVIATKQLILHYSVKTPKEVDFIELMKEIKSLGTLGEFSVTN